MHPPSCNSNNSDERQLTDSTHIRRDRGQSGSMVFPRTPATGSWRSDRGHVARSHVSGGPSKFSCDRREGLSIALRQNRHVACQQPRGADDGIGTGCTSVGEPLMTRGIGGGGLAAEASWVSLTSARSGWRSPPGGEGLQQRLPENGAGAARYMDHPCPARASGDQHGEIAEVAPSGASLRARPDH
jgi:hypothetical protein